MNEQKKKLTYLHYLPIYTILFQEFYICLNWAFESSQKIQQQIVVISSENRGAGDDGIQAGDGSVQVVGTPGQSGELHPRHWEETLHQFPQTGK